MKQTWLLWVALGGCAAEPEADSVDAQVGPDACGVGCQGEPDPMEALVLLRPAEACGVELPPLTCEALIPRQIPLPDCAQVLEVEAIDGLDTLTRPFDADYEISAQFQVRARPGDTVRWAVAGSIPSIIDIDPCSGTLSGTLHWSESLPLQVVAVVGEGTDCRMGTLEIPTGAPTCAIRVPSSTRQLSPAVMGQPYTADLPIWNPEGGSGSGRIRWVGGTMPPGLALDCEGARLVGTPQEEGEFSFEIEWIEHACSGVTAVDQIHITVAP